MANTNIRGICTIFSQQ